MKHIKQFLEDKSHEDLLRSLKPLPSGSKMVDYSSNDYLGLSKHPKLKEASIEAAGKYGTSSSASRLLSGDHDLFHQLEIKVASFKSKESALVFNSGYQANIGIIPALVKEGDVVFIDKLSHASLIDGVLLSGAKFFRFKHNNAEDLKKLLKHERGKHYNSLIITESVFSMDGDISPLSEIVALKKEYDSILYVDEAHATGIYGNNGSGVAEELGLSNDIDIIMGTFGKALGSFGAYIACSQEIKDYLINTCRSFIFSTALPLSVVAVNMKAIDIVNAEYDRRERLRQLSVYFIEKLKASGIRTSSLSHIIPVIIGENRETIEVSEFLKSGNYWVLPIRYPTVPKGESRLRFSLTSEISHADIDGTIDLLSKSIKH